MAPLKPGALREKLEERIAPRHPKAEQIKARLELADLLLHLGCLQAAEEHLSWLVPAAQQEGREETACQAYLFLGRFTRGNR